MNTSAPRTQAVLTFAVLFAFSIPTLGILATEQIGHRLLANHVMAPGQVCRVYMNEYHPERCGFSYGSGSAIWNNTGDCAYLRDSGGGSVDTYCY